MTKSKTIIAALGIVAGLGAAALPLASYATQTSQSVSGNVLLAVEVQPAIAMTITGNNDDNSHYAASATGVSVYNPAALSTNDDFDGYDATATGAAAYNSAALQLSSSYTEILPNAKVDGNATNLFGSTVTVYTNSSTGYTLAVKDTDGSVLALTNTNGDTIAAGTTIEAGTPNWAYQVQKSDDTDVASPAYAAITGSDVTIVTRDTETSDGSESFIGYGVSTSADQATGVYTNTITYTATTK